MANFRRNRFVDKQLTQLLKTELPVAKLATRFPTGYRNTRGNVRHSYGRVGSIHALPTWATSPKRLDLTIARHLFSGLLCIPRIVPICQMFAIHGFMIS